MIHSTKPPTTLQTGVLEQSRIILSRTPFCGVVDGLCGAIDGLCGVVGGLCGVVDAICGATYDLILSGAEPAGMKKLFLPSGRSSA